jgi:hypothetical protein
MNVFCCYGRWTSYKIQEKHSDLYIERLKSRNNGTTVKTNMAAVELYRYAAIF